MGIAEPIATESRPILALDIAQDGKGYAGLVWDGGMHIIETAPSAGSPGKRYQPGPFEADAIHNTPTLADLTRPPKNAVACGYGRGKPRLGHSLTPRKQGSPAGPAGTGSLRRNPAVLLDARQPAYRSGDAGEVRRRPRHLWIADLNFGRRASIDRRPLVGIRARRFSGRIENPFQKDADGVLAGIGSAGHCRCRSDRHFRDRSENAGVGQHQEEFDYQSNRNGPPEIWLHANGWDRPVVGPAQFPAVPPACS